MSSIVLLWAVVLIGLRCAGHKRVGMVCSGTPPPRVRRHKKLESAEKPPLEGADDEPTRITEQQTVVVKSEGQSLTSARLMQNLRLVVLGCCVGMIVCIILLMTKGVPNLIQASSHVSAALLDSQSLTNDAIVLWDAYVERQKITIQETQAYLQDFNSFCPTKFENETLCTNITDVSSCDWSALPSVIAPLVESLFVSSLALIWDDVNDIRDDLVELYDVFGQAHDASNNFDWVFALATLFAVLLLLLTLLLTLGIVHLIFFWEPDLSPQSQPSLMQSTVANRTEEKAVHWSTKVFQSVCSFANASRHYNWCWLPLFIFFVAMTLFFSLAFSVGTVTSADMCYGSPDENVILVLQKSGVVENLLLSFFLFYIRGCPRDQIPDHYMQAIQTVDAVAQDLQALLYELQNESTTEEPWQVTCGTDPVLLEATSNALQETVCTVEDALMDLQEFLACENFRPVYR